MDDLVIDLHGKSEMVVTHVYNRVEIHLTEATIINGKKHYKGINKVLTKEQTLELLMYLYKVVFEKGET